MKLIQTAQKNLAVLGIAPHLSRRNSKTVMTNLVFDLTTISNVAYLFVEAKSLQEYAFGIYITSAIALVIFMHATIVFKKHSMFEPIGKLEQAIDESAYICLFSAVKNVWMFFLKHIYVHFRI